VTFEANRAGSSRYVVMVRDDSQGIPNCFSVPITICVSSKVRTDNASRVLFDKPRANMGYCTTCTAVMAHQFNLQTLKDWKLLCLMFNDNSSKCKQLLKGHASFGLLDKNDKDVGAFQGWEIDLIKLGKFFNSVEHELTDNVDLKPKYSALMKLFNEHGFGVNETDPQYNLQISHKFGSVTVWGVGDRQETESYSNLSSDVEIMNKFQEAFKEIGVPDGAVEMKICTRSG
jgi:hypothetical protein